MESIEKTIGRGFLNVREELTIPQFDAIQPGNQ
jgi:hypothetical protein